MRYDRATFFSYIRQAPFGGRLTQQQVDGVSLILDHWNATNPDGDVRHLAYILATAFHETGNRMVPVREGFAKDDASARRILSKYTYAKPDKTTGHAYYGRGLVQITHKANYDRMGKILGLDLVNNPDLALDANVSAKIIIEGMTRGVSNKGDFTKYSLEDFFNKTVDNPYEARKIVNALDKAGLIESYYHHFLNSLRAATHAESVGERPQEVTPKTARADGPETLLKDKTTVGAVILGSGGFFGSLIGAINNPWALGAFVVLAIGAFLVITGRVELKYKKGA